MKDREKTVYTTALKAMKIKELPALPYPPGDRSKACAYWAKIVFWLVCLLVVVYILSWGITTLIIEFTGLGFFGASLISCGITIIISAIAFYYYCYKLPGRGMTPLRKLHLDSVDLLLTILFFFCLPFIGIIINIGYEPHGLGMIRDRVGTCLITLKICMTIISFLETYKPQEEDVIFDTKDRKK